MTISFPAVVLKTPRLILRPLRQLDAAALFSMYSDPAVTRHLGRPPWQEISQAIAFITKDEEALAVGRFLRLGIVLDAEERFLGECSVFNFNEQCRRAEIGYALAASAWGNGYMAEALAALLGFAFSELNMNRLEADIDPRNTGSARSLERAGFRKEGYMRERWIVSGEKSDSELYGLLRREWTGSASATA